MHECILYWLDGTLKIAVDEILPMDAFRTGLSKIINRSVHGKVVMIIESADWTASSPPSRSPHIPI